MLRFHLRHHQRLPAHRCLDSTAQQQQYKQEGTEHHPELAVVYDGNGALDLHPWKRDLLGRIPVCVAKFWVEEGKAVCGGTGAGVSDAEWGEGGVA